MKTKDFLKQHSACTDGAKWALSISEEMDDVWDALIEQGKHEWLIWTVTRPGVFPDSSLRKISCRFVRETPLADGHKVWDLLTDERSRRAVEVAESYADGKATYEELQAACAAAYAAVYGAALDAARAAARAAAYAAASDAARAARAAAAAYDSADAAADAAAYTAARAAFAACATRDAAFAAARDTAKAAQVRMIAEIGNPFKKGQKE